MRSLGAIARELVYTAGAPEGGRWGLGEGEGEEEEEQAGMKQREGGSVGAPPSVEAGAGAGNGAGAGGNRPGVCSAGDTLGGETGEEGGEGERSLGPKECATDAQFSGEVQVTESDGEDIASDADEAESGAGRGARAKGTGGREPGAASVHPGSSSDVHPQGSSPVHRGQPSARKLRTGSILDLLRRVAPKMMARADANWGYGMASDLQDPKYNHPKYWSNPLETK